MSHVTTGGSRLNVRSGPGSDFPVIASAQNGSSYPVLALDASGDWVQIVHPDAPGGAGWVSARFVRPSSAGACHQPGKRV